MNLVEKKNNPNQNLAIGVKKIKEKFGFAETKEISPIEGKYYMICLESVEKLENLQDKVKNSDEKLLIKDLISAIYQKKLNIPRMPVVALKINSMLSDPNLTIQQLGTVIKSDPELSLKILNISNSPLFLSNKINKSIEIAVVRLGLKFLKNIILTLSVESKVLNTSTFLQEAKTIWLHSFGVATLSHTLAGYFNIDRDDAYLTGLMHEIGKMVIFDFIQSFETQKKQKLFLNKLFLHHFLDQFYPMFGALTLIKWKLDLKVIENIHKQKNVVEKSILQQKVLYVADNILTMLQSGPIISSKVETLFEFILPTDNIRTILEMIQQFAENFKKTASFILNMK